MSCGTGIHGVSLESAAGTLRDVNASATEHNLPSHTDP